MSLVSFSDADGTRWRVWKVDTPPARAHLMDIGFRSGWLVFEREDEGERRRLSQVPDDWESLSPERLALLCGIATPALGPRVLETGQRERIGRPDDVPGPGS